MKKICKIFICILFVSAIACFCTVGLAACNGQVPDSVDMPEGTLPSLPNRITAEDLDVIEAGMAEGADRQAVSNAVIRLYDIANQSRIQDGTSLMLQESTMWLAQVGPASTIESLGLLALVRMRGFTLKAGSEWYNEFAAQVVDGVGDLYFAVTLFSTMVKINYHTNSDPDAYYFNIMKSNALDCDCALERFPYESYLLIQPPTKYDLQGFENAANVLDAPNEIYNMDFVPGIIAQGATIEHEGGAYKVHFAVDMSADPQLLKDWYRLPQKDMSEGGQTIEQYYRYECDFEVWDNGYAKTYSAEYSRNAGMGSGITRDKFNFLWNESEIMEIISDDYRLDNVDLVEKHKLVEPADYINYYIDADIVAGRLSSLYIALIVIACLVFAAIVTWIVIEVLVRKGKLPRLAAWRQARKQKRIAKRAVKKGTGNGGGSPDPDEHGDIASTAAPEEVAQDGETVANGKPDKGDGLNDKPTAEASDGENASADKSDGARDEVLAGKDEGRA